MELAGEYKVMNGAPTIWLYWLFTLYEDIWWMNPNWGDQPIEGQLSSLVKTRQCAILHELTHVVGSLAHYGPVIPGTDPATGISNGGEILDQRIADAANGWGDKKFLWKHLSQNFFPKLWSKKDLEWLKVYDEKPVLLLPQLKSGPIYAAHNAENYALFGMANWNSKGQMVPERGEPAFWWKTANRRDPFENLPPPFDVPGQKQFKLFWMNTGRTRGIGGIDKGTI
ncbi:hypothetical protein HYFRA_00005985 [Hymenoscyphus fraxineus]|uniref:Uncharacterized protein n=1 Tax=Hymenoscyphus fraxineus TaxID=746836 RepID=A0A9N9KYC6_9HELO|nr:hypothetical protein HYFRA_00005985 [Hymenoscyphus fraxineus]